MESYMIFYTALIENRAVISNQRSQIASFKKRVLHLWVLLLLSSKL